MGNIMIIGVGEAGYNMVSGIRLESADEELKNAKYVFAHNLASDCRYIVEKDGRIHLNLWHIDLDKDIPSNFFQDIEKVYIVAGMGGKTGTYWTPIISQYAKRKGCKLVIAIVSEPFAFEGRIRMDKARAGITQIIETNIDKVFCLQCEELHKRYNGLVFFLNAFECADYIIRSIIEGINKHTIIDEKDIEFIIDEKDIEFINDEINMKTKITAETKSIASEDMKYERDQDMEKVAPKGLGKLDMVIAFDTTGSMAAYIEDVRRQVGEMIPRLFKDNKDLRLGIVAFGDYCDMESRDTFGDAYQCIPLTDNENDIIKFVKESKDTSGGDGDEFYELVLKKIVEESPWREDSSKAILLIADADPHDLGYTYRDFVVDNQISWKVEAQKAANMKIKIDTVSIAGRTWYKELSAMTNGISVPFKSSEKTRAMIETATVARSAMAFEESARSSDDEVIQIYCQERSSKLKEKLFETMKTQNDEELNDICELYSRIYDKSDK